MNAEIIHRLENSFGGTVFAKALDYAKEIDQYVQSASPDGKPTGIPCLLRERAEYAVQVATQAEELERAVKAAVEMLSEASALRQKGEVIAPPAHRRKAP